MTLPTLPVEPPPSVWEDLLELFYAPRAVFERRRTTPAFGLALFVFFLGVVGLTVAFKDLTAPIFDAEFQRGMARAMAKNPQLTPERMEAGKAFAQKFVVFGVGIYALVTPLLLGVVLWAAGKLVNSTAELGQSAMVATYAMFPRLLEAIVNAIQLLVLPESAITGRYSVSLGLGRFLDPEKTNLMLLGALGRVDVFTLWVTVLMVIGLAVMGRITVARAAIAGLVVWVVGLAPVVWGAVTAG